MNVMKSGLARSESSSEDIDRLRDERPSAGPRRAVRTMSKEREENTGTYPMVFSFGYKPSAGRDRAAAALGTRGGKPTSMNLKRAEAKLRHDSAAKTLLILSLSMFWYFDATCSVFSEAR